VGLLVNVGRIITKLIALVNQQAAGTKQLIF